MSRIRFYLILRLQNYIYSPRSINQHKVSLSTIQTQFKFEPFRNIIGIFIYNWSIIICANIVFNEYVRLISENNVMCNIEKKINGLKTESWVTQNIKCSLEDIYFCKRHIAFYLLNASLPNLHIATNTICINYNSALEFRFDNVHYISFSCSYNIHCGINIW